MKISRQSDDVSTADEEFYVEVTRSVSERVTPIYNSFILVFAAIFGYFAIVEQPQCYSKEGKAYKVNYSETVDVTFQFRLLSIVGCLLLCAQAAIYHIRIKENMFERMKYWNISMNLCVLTWFVTLQYARLQDSGRACSGDFLSGGFANPFKTKDDRFVKSKEF